MTETETQPAEEETATEEVQEQDLPGMESAQKSAEEQVQTMVRMCLQEVEAVLSRYHCEIDARPTAEVVGTGRRWLVGAEWIVRPSR